MAMTKTRNRPGRSLLGVLAVLLAAAPVLVSAWAFGGMRGDVLRGVLPPVLSVVLVGLLLVPQCRADETFGAARRRTWREAWRDPLLWASLALLAYLCLPLFNVGLKPLRDVVAAADVQGAPRWSLLPFCVVGAEHAGVLCWFAAALVASLGVRHALTRHGKRLLYEVLVWNGALMAVFGFVQILTGARFPFWGEVPHPVHFFSVFAYPNMAGAYFMLNYALSLGLWILRIEDVENVSMSEEKRARAPAHPGLRAHYPAVAAALLFSAVLATYCRAAISLALVLTALFSVYVALRPLAGKGATRVRRFRSIVAVGGILLALAGGIFVYAPPDVGRELRTINVFAVSDRVTGKGEYHTRIATAIMRDFPLFGVGGWGYRHYSARYLAGEDAARQVQAVGGANVHNDYLQFLAEHGAVGFALIALCFLLLVKPVLLTWRRLDRIEFGRARASMEGASLAVFSLSAPVLWTFLGTLGVLVHAFGDCPLRAASVLTLLFAVQAAAEGFLPLDLTVHCGAQSAETV